MKRAVRIRGLLSGLMMLVSAAASCAENGVQPQTPDSLVDAFIELALKSDYSTRERPVRKWTAPIRYAIVHRVGEEQIHTALVETHLRHLAEITGVSIEPAAAESQANYLVVLTREDAFDRDTRRYAGADPDGRRERFFRNSICLATVRTEARGAIVRAVAMIPVDRARGQRDLVGCVVEELTHMLGLSNDTHRPLPTIFHHGAMRSFLTGLDYLVLRMLYDPRVKPGMKQAALLPVLRKIARELEQAQILQDADRIAGGGGLSGTTP